MPADIPIRRAHTDDAEAIAAVHLRTWQAAYRHIFPPTQLDALSLQPRVDAWRAGLANPRGVCLVAGEPVVGFVYVQPAETDTGVGEVDAIYVEPSSWGTGIGRALLEAGERALLELGFAEAILWVVEDNPRARRFDERAGWTYDGGRRPWPRLGAEPTLVRYRKDLSTQALFSGRAAGPGGAGGDAAGGSGR